MEKTYRPYSRLVVAFKVAILPPLLAVVDVASASSVSAEYLTSLSMLFKSIAILMIEVLFLFGLGWLNKAEIASSIRATDNTIRKLQTVRPDVDSVLQKDIDKKLKSLYALKVKLLDE